MATVILPYKQASASSKVLAQLLGTKRMKLTESSLRNSTQNTIINWGNSNTDLSQYTNVTVINNSESVGLASNKLKTFQAFARAGEPVSCPRWTTEKWVAQEWLEGGKDIVVRHLLRGHSAAGVEMVNHVEGRSPDLPDAPLYVSYVKKRDEYRVHIVKGVVTDVQRKARQSDTPLDLINWQIRNHGNGFVFIRGSISPDPSIIVQAQLAVKALGLDFGAVDVIWNQREGVAYVLEVNTACGLEGVTASRYSEAFKNVLSGQDPTAFDAPDAEIVATDLFDQLFEVSA